MKKAIANILIIVVRSRRLSQPNSDFGGSTSGHPSARGRGGQRTQITEIAGHIAFLQINASGCPPQNGNFKSAFCGHPGALRVIETVIETRRAVGGIGALCALATQDEVL